MAGRLLADLGAELWKVEPIKGDVLRHSGWRVGGSSYLFHINNAGKKSLAIEPKHPEGRELILQLARQTDIWLENMAPGTVAGMGYSYQELSAINPQLIYCSLSGFGHHSLYGQKRALDTVVQAMTGHMSVTGHPDQPPVKVGISASDLTSAVAAAAAITAALRRRRQTGRGEHIDLAMADVGVWMTQRFWPGVLAGAGSPERIGNRGRHQAPHNIYPAADGLVALAAEDDGQWQRLTDLIGRPELARDPRFATAADRLREVDTVDGLVAAWVAPQPAAAVVETCQARGVPAAPVRSVGDVAEDPNSWQRGLVRSVDHPEAGAMKLLSSPFAFSRTATGVTAHAPILGEHTADVLRERLGLSEERLAALAAAGAIYLAPAAGAHGGGD